jgi:hypothetical protein
MLYDKENDYEDQEYTPHRHFLVISPRDRSPSIYQSFQ